MTLWNVAVLTLLPGAMGGVVRYTVQADGLRWPSNSVRPVDHLHAWNCAEMADVPGHEGCLPREHDAGD
jgi:hypothetical protein